MNKKILEFCEKAKYIVKVCKINSNKCLTLFPKRLFGHPIIDCQDLIHEISQDGAFYKIKRNDPNGERILHKIPDYAVRPLIIQDIFLKCGFLGIDNDLVIGYNEKDEPVEPLIHAIPQPSTVKFDKEVQTAKIYTKTNLGMDCKKESKALKIEQGLAIIEQFINESAYRFLNEEILD